MSESLHHQRHTGMRTLVIAAGVLLRAEPASEQSMLLVEVRPGKRPKTWRAVPHQDVDKHAHTWATEHGVEHECCPDCGAPPSYDSDDGPYQCEGDHS